MLPVVFLGGLLDSVGWRRTFDWSLRGLGAAVAVVVIVGLDRAVRILLGRVDHIVVGGGGSASSSLIVQPEKTRKQLGSCERGLAGYGCVMRADIVICSQ